jgi:hypothetical protein
MDWDRKLKVRGGKVAIDGWKVKGGFTHVDRYRHPVFPSGKYWEDLRGEHVSSHNVEDMPAG